MKRIPWGCVALLSLFAVMLWLRFVGFSHDGLVNIAPIAAVGLCFGLFFRVSVLGLALAMAALMISDVFVDVLSVQRDPALSFWGLIFSPTVLLRYLVYLGIFAVAWSLRERRSPLLAFGLTPCATLGFYAIMNTVAWALSTPPFAYAKTLAGWWQSQTVGLPIPGTPPSYVFLRNALFGDALFTLLFVVLMVWLPHRRAGQSPMDSPLKVSEKVV